MNEETSGRKAELSPRLSLVASFCLDVPLTDIGSDHGWLPVFLAESGFKSPLAASEKGLGPFKRLEADIRLAGLEKRIQVLRGDGLAVLPAGCEEIVLTGMGGLTIKGILEQGQEKLNGVRYLIAEPQTEAEETRREIQSLGFKEDRGIYLEEKGHIYPLTRYARGQEELTETEFRFGKKALAAEDPWLLELLSREEKRLSGILGGLDAGSRRSQEIKKELALIRQAQGGK
jgi:tRNA (adenine22-N1)-methyltransferase